MIAFVFSAPAVGSPLMVSGSTVPHAVAVRVYRVSFGDAADFLVEKRLGVSR